MLPLYLRNAFPGPVYGTPASASLGGLRFQPASGAIRPDGVTKARRGSGEHAAAEVSGEPQVAGPTRRRRVLPAGSGTGAQPIPQRR